MFTKLCAVVNLTPFLTRSAIVQNRNL